MNQMPPPNVSIGAGGVTTCSPAASSVFGSSLLQPEPPIYTTLNAYCPNTSLSTSAPSYPTATISYLPPHQQSQAFQQHQSLHHPQRLVALKEEPQIVPDFLSSDGSPPMSPINLETQERIKAERKKLRNRLAATKCRRRKLERISRLEDKVAHLKQKVLTHVSSGCQLMLTSKLEAF
ncbi:hypothetical protein KUCAC02_035813 [Chaenocephalus aceratus]|nr:hypothetical protein KUCAC02_035813 [Chaenocephalus aceratus]